QQYQGKVSIASGKLFGYGFGNGPRVKTGIVPEQENDFILTVAGEEFGYIGCILLFAILILLMVKILITGLKSSENVGSYLCYGIFSMIMTQSVINIGMVLGFLPVIGITLPLFSSGGTSAMCIYLGVGIVQSVYIHNKIEPSDKLKKSKYRHLIDKKEEKSSLL
ncbi:MAG: FtsW/RodA/SpoVE family cell cycle protein, partial [Acutalibacteraceae bacterium]